MKSAAAFAALGLALSPACALAAAPARSMERAMPDEPMSGRAAVRSGEPPVGMGRGEK